MIIESFHEPPPPGLARALAAFERQFSYPLGPGRSFRIEHGDDYARFYRAIGDARCFVAISEGCVLGVLSVALRPLLLPDGNEVGAAYIGDLKVARQARSSPTLYRLARTAEAWARPQAGVGFGVVMDGTAAVPARYTGRAGIPLFEPVGKLVIFRFTCAGAGLMEDQWEAREADVRDCHHRLSSGRFACPSGNPQERSSIEPVWLMRPDGSACGCLEDTRRAKRLITGNEEMGSAHLSCFAFRDARAGADLLRAALGRAAALGFPALFVSVAARDADGLESALKDVQGVRAPATVFGHNTSAVADSDWSVNSSEI
jgi:hypothetical protein